MAGVLLNKSFYAKVRIDFEHGGIIVAIKDGIADDRLNLYVDACVFIRSVDMFNRSFKIFLFNLREDCRLNTGLTPSVCVI